MNAFLKGAAIAGITAIGVGIADGAIAGTLVSLPVDFRAPGPNEEELIYDLGHGVTLTVTAGRHSGGASADSPFRRIRGADITQSNRGLGVDSSTRRDDDTSNQLDGRGQADMLRFTFSQEVELHKVLFASVQTNDEFDAAIDGFDLDVEDSFDFVNPPGLDDGDRLIYFPEGPGNNTHIVDFSGGVDFDGDGTNQRFAALGTIFDFYTTERNDDYRIAAMKVWTEVPEPATMFGLLGVGAMLLGSARKRQNT